MKWYRISDYAITNGREFSGPRDEYQHGTHIISKSIVGGAEKFTVWEGEKMVGIFDDAGKAKEAVNA